MRAVTRLRNWWRERWERPHDPPEVRAVLRRSQMGVLMDEDYWWRQIELGPDYPDQEWLRMLGCPICGRFVDPDAVAKHQRHHLDRDFADLRDELTQGDHRSEE